MNNEVSSRRVKLLRDDVARKIAAGEVIDRPFSVVRELLDNAIDAGADSIKLDLKNGGISSIRVSDNGCGMSREDLELCFLPHATSKIESVEDLYRTTSLGFRGEALGSIGSCARLTITSGRDAEINRLTVAEGTKISLEPYRGAPGTSVEVQELFYNLPGRRRFLKSAQSEGTLCRTTFLEKAAAFPEVQFQLLNEGRPKTTLPPGTLVERAVAAYPSVFPPGTTESFSGEYGNFSFTIVHASPAVFRRDRRYIHVYLNRRRIQEYSLMQAVEYGFSTVLPGGSYPVALLFLDVDPELVDFNIHPAKREARIKNLQEIHHAVSSRIQEEVRTPRSVHAGTRPFARERDLTGFTAPSRSVSDNAAERPVRPQLAGRQQPLSRRPDDAAERIDSWKEITAPQGIPRDESPIRYLGQAFNLFLICQAEDQLFMVDQHAAHERILYERFVQPGQESQGLLVPLEIAVENRDEEGFYKELLTRLKPLGFKGRLTGDTLEIEAIPASYRGVEKELAAFLTEPRGSVDNFLRELYADMACKAAVKDGEPLDGVSARELVKEAFRLPEHRCPHGRPIWYSLSRAELFALVGRT